MCGEVSVNNGSAGVRGQLSGTGSTNLSQITLQCNQSAAGGYYQVKGISHGRTAVAAGNFCQQSLISHHKQSTDAEINNILLHSFTSGELLWFSLFKINRAENIDTLQTQCQSLLLNVCSGSCYKLSVFLKIILVYLKLYTWQPQTPRLVQLCRNCLTTNP